MRRGGNDLHDHTGLYLIVQRDHAPVHLGADHLIADLGVNGIGKVHHSGTLRQPDHIAARRKDENFLRRDVGLDGFYDILHIVGILLRFQQLPDPRQALVQRVLALHADLILPMRRDTVFRRIVHIPGADLHLKGHALFIQHGGVQRLVHVLLGGGNIVLEPVGDRAQHIVDNAQNVVALQHGIHNDTHRVNIVDLIKGASLHVHLAVNAVNAFYPSVDLRGDMLLLQPRLNALDNIAEECLPIFFSQRKLLFYFMISHRIKMFERKVLQLLLDTANPQPVCQRSVNFHRFQRLDTLLFRNSVVQGAHIVQPVCQLDNDDPDILCHRQQHFTHIFRLLLCAAGVWYIGKLCHAVHQFGNISAELLFNIVQRYRSILNNIVQ